MTTDIVDRLRLDPGQRTLGQLLQDREAALHEILRLRKRLVPESPEARQPKATAEHSAQVPKLPDPVPARPAGTLLRRKEVSALLGISQPPPSMPSSPKASSPRRCASARDAFDGATRT